MNCVWLEEASHQFHLEKRGFTAIVLEIDRFSKTSCLFLTKINITNLIIHNNVMITKRLRRWDGDDEDEDEDEENFKEDNDDEDMIKMTIRTSAIIVLMVADQIRQDQQLGKRILSLKRHFHIVRSLKLLFTESHFAQTLLLTLKTLPRPSYTHVTLHKTITDNLSTSVQCSITIQTAET